MREPHQMRKPGSPAERGLIDLCDHVREHLTVEHMAELGVWQGESTAIFWGALRPRELIAVDAWMTRYKRDWRDHDSAEAAFRERVECMLECAPNGGARVVPLKMDTVTAAAHVADHSLDLVYIDASHNYDSVRADILAWLPKVKRGGMMAGHDYDFAMSQSRGYGVIRAVHEIFCCPDFVFADSSWLVRPTRKRCMTGKRTWLKRRK